jgi:glycosyltransferase involved in cell wall biosynthesis
LVTPAVNVESDLATFGPDLVFLANPALLGLVGLRHARALDLPVVASYHTDIPYYTEQYGLGLLREPAWAYFRWLHNQADLNLCPSRFTKRQLLAQGFERVQVWPRGVDHDRFHPGHRSQHWRERLSGGHPGTPLLLYVGRLAPEKRVDWLRPVLDALPEARLAIVGDGPSRAELEERFAGTPTVFTGYLRGEDLSHAYASADVFCFPSDSETFGNVVLEAMASGLPVITPNAGGQVDHVRHDEHGFIFPSEDRQALVKQVTRLIDDPRLARQMGARARAYARTQTWDAILGKLFENVQGVLDGDHWSGARPGTVPHRSAPLWMAGLGEPTPGANRDLATLPERRWSRQNPGGTAWTRLLAFLNQNTEGDSKHNAYGTTPHSRHE